MKNEPTQTIIQQIQPQCDNLYKKMKHEKDMQHKTNRGLAERTGIPISTTAKFFSGVLSNPGIFSVTAWCIDLSLSLDVLMGISRDNDSECVARIAELEVELASEKREIELLKNHNKQLEAGIAERKPIIYGLAGLCLLLTFAVLAYIVIDMRNLNFGFFRSDNFSGGLIALTLGIGILIVAARHIIKNKAKNKDDNTTEKR